MCTASIGGSHMIEYMATVVELHVTLMWQQFCCGQCFAVCTDRPNACCTSNARYTHMFGLQGYQGMIDGGKYIQLAEWKTVSNILNKVWFLSLECVDFTDIIVYVDFKPQCYCMIRQTFLAIYICIYFGAMHFSFLLLYVWLIEILLIAELMTVPGLCCSRYTGCQSVSASVTKSPLWHSSLVRCHRRRTWIHCWMTTSRHGLSDFPVCRIWSFQERVQNLPSERSPSLILLYGTVRRSTSSTLDVDARRRR